MVKKILFASVLKPCNDTRMFAKMAAPLLSEGYEVHVAGFKTDFFHESKVNFHFINEGNRFSLNRFLAGLRFLSLCFKLNPDLIVVCTHELLFPVLIYKLFRKVKWIYDIQENYFYNIIYTNAFNVFVKRIIAEYVKVKELIAVKFVDKIVLAEKCYEQELSYLLKGKDYQIFQNLFLNDKNYPIWEFKEENRNHFVYAGTIAFHYGVENAILFVQHLNKEGQSCKLTIIGYCADEKYRDYLINNYSHLTFIHWIGVDKLVAHSEIINTMLQSHAVLLPYKSNKSTENRIPTKVFECLSLGIPMIANECQIWSEVIKDLNAGLCIDFENYNFEIEGIKRNVFFRKVKFNHNFKWKMELWSKFVNTSIL